MYSICYSASLPIGASSLQYTRPRSVGRPVCEVRERDDEWVKWNVRNSMPPRHSETCFCFSFVWLDGIANDLGMVGSVATHRCRPPPPLPIIHARAQHESDGFYWAQFRAALRAVASYERHTQNCMRRMCVRTWRHRWCVRNIYLCAFFSSSFIFNLFHIARQKLPFVWLIRTFRYSFMRRTETEGSPFDFYNFSVLFSIL